MLATSLEARTRIDEFLPDHDFRAVYQIRIKATRSVVYECLLHSDFADLRLTRLLMTLRNGKRMSRQERRGGLLQRLHGTGFVVLEEVPDDELLSEWLDASGVPMATAAWISRQPNSSTFPEQDLQRRRGILSCALDSQKQVPPFLQPKPEFDASARQLGGSSASIGLW